MATPEQTPVEDEGHRYRRVTLSEINASILLPAGWTQPNIGTLPTCEDYRYYYIFEDPNPENHTGLILNVFRKMEIEAAEKAIENIMGKTDYVTAETATKEFELGILKTKSRGFTTRPQNLDGFRIPFRMNIDETTLNTATGTLYVISYQTPLELGHKRVALIGPTFTEKELDPTF